MASKKKAKTARPKTEAKSVQNVPEGYFGDFGGRFVSELLIPALDELNAAWKKYSKDKKFEIRRFKGNTFAIQRDGFRNRV